MTTLAERGEQSDHVAVRAREGVEELMGYGVMGVPFASGHVLCLRHFPASTFGPGYNSIWHRAPDGAWTVYTSVAPEVSCPRFLSAQLTRAIRTPIEVEWTSGREFVVHAPEVGFRWEVALGGNAVTHAMNALMAGMPGPLWRNNAVLSLMSGMATLTLGAGRVRLRGRVPNRQWYQAGPRSIWTMSRSHAVLDGENFGPVGALEDQAALADFAIPQRGLFFFGGALFEALDPQRHVTDAAALFESGAEA